MVADAFLMMGAAAIGHVVALTVALGVRQRVRAAAGPKAVSRRVSGRGRQDAAPTIDEAQGR